MNGSSQDEAAPDDADKEASRSERVLRATLDVPIECAFTRSGVMNGLPTYRAPPIPTIQGLLYAALGRPSLLKVGRSAPIDKDVRDREETFRSRVSEECSFGIRIVDSGTKRTGLRKRHKASRSDVEKAYGTYVAQAETLISPSYRIYVGGPDELLSSFRDGLVDPERLLYLGRSDDIVDVKDVELATAMIKDESAVLDCVIPGPGEDPSLLPVEPDYRSGRSTQPAKVATVSINGGEVDEYLEFDDEERFVYIT